MTPRVEHLHSEVIEACMRRARRERAQAFAALGRWLVRSITGRLRRSGPTSVAPA